MKQNFQKWQQFNLDLNSIWVWLGDMEEELEQFQCLEFSIDIQIIEFQIKKFKEFQKVVDYCKVIIFFINFCSFEFIQVDSKESWDLQDCLLQMNGCWD